MKANREDVLEAQVRNLIACLEPFTKDDLVTETSGTLPYLDRAENAIRQARNVLEAPGATRPYHVECRECARLVTRTVDGFCDDCIEAKEGPDSRIEYEP